MSDGTGEIDGNSLLGNWGGTESREIILIGGALHGTRESLPEELTDPPAEITKAVKENLDIGEFLREDDNPAIIKPSFSTVRYYLCPNELGPDDEYLYTANPDPYRPTVIGGQWSHGEFAQYMKMNDPDTPLVDLLGLRGRSVTVTVTDELTEGAIDAFKAASRQIRDAAGRIKRDGLYEWTRESREPPEPTEPVDRDDLLA